MRTSRWIAVAMIVSLAACSKPGASAGADSDASQGASAPPGTFLAYEHNVTIALGKQDIPVRLAAAQASCLAQTFGNCVVLDVEQRGGEFPHGKLTVRIVPKGVEPMIRQAGQGGDVNDRSTRAEDLADVVRDTSLQNDRLEKEHARLLEFEARPNLSVADMLALSKQLADVESQLDAAQHDAAQQQRRIDTNLLTLEFQLPGGASGRSEIGQAFSDFGEILASATAFLIRAFAMLIPVSIVFAGILMFWRWRRRSRNA